MQQTAKFLHGDVPNFESRKLQLADPKLQMTILRTSSAGAVSLVTL